jgi:hypothetical protein
VGATCEALDQAAHRDGQEGSLSVAAGVRCAVEPSLIACKVYAILAYGLSVDSNHHWQDCGLHRLTRPLSPGHRLPNWGSPGWLRGGRRDYDAL